MNVFDTTTATAAGLGQVDSVADAVRARANIFEMTQAAEDAVLRPNETGALPHDLRAALAARMARQAGETRLAEHHLAGAGALTDLVDPQHDGGKTHSGLISFVDKVSTKTRDITARDIVDLQGAGMSDADIVRLCEMVAFVAYQIRVVAGLRLMQGAVA